EVAEIKCFARPGSALKDRKTVNSLAEFPDKILMPLPAAAAVVEADRFRTEDRVRGQSDGVATDVVSTLLDQMEIPARRSGGLEVSLAELGHKTLDFH